jgi:two-component system chemotaxis response regulator CheY
VIQSLRVLIVEDSPAMRQLLSLTVRRRKEIQVVEAADGLEALRRLTEGHYHLLFIDLNMPVLDGMKLIKRVREDPASMGSKICVVTTESAESTEAQARGLGADFYLRKPIQRQDIERVLGEALPVTLQGS